MSIQVHNLCKTFRTKEKPEGLSGSWRSLWKPQWRQTSAIQDVSFRMESGECLGFIGPQWRGQIHHHQDSERHPASRFRHGSGSGLHPWQERAPLCYEIGSVFGQRPQLWYHLPPADSFRLYGAVYGLDAMATRRRVDFLVDVFELQHLVHTPVRKLSLGQRMRCEVAVSLLHAPRLLLLDEPSIGLDVVAKQRIRDTIRHMQEEEGVGVLLTSHDVGDIEALCERGHRHQPWTPDL